MASQGLREQILERHAAYKRGERAFIADMLHEQTDWQFFISPEALPVPSHVSGKWHVLLALQKIDAELEIIDSDLLLLLVDGDRAATICERTFRQRKTGRVMQYKTAAFHRYAEGKLIEYREFGDGLDMLEQALGRGIDAPVAYE